MAMNMSNALMSLSLSLTLSGVLPDPTRDALQATADRWFHWLLISSGVVAVGVALEAWEATIDLKRWYRLKRGRQVAEPNGKSWAIPTAYLGWVLVVAGVVGEGVFEARVSNSDTALRAHDSRMLAQAETDAGEAKLRAAELELQTTKLEERTLELGPRDLLLYGKREEAFMNGIRQFKGQKVQIRICIFNNNEVRDTAERLTALFKLADWKVSPWSPDWGESNCLMPPESLATGFGIWVGTPSAVPNAVTQGRAKKLLELLQSIPLLAKLHKVRPDTGRAESGKTIEERYDDPDSLVVVVLSHSFERSKMPIPTTGPMIVF